MIGLLYKLKTRVLLLFMLSAVLELNGESGKENSFTCYKCYSLTSWEDCDNKIRGIDCDDDARTCIKVERTWLEYTKNSSELKTEYTRRCTIPEQCTQQECREKNWACKTDCCFTQMCNTSNIMSPHTLLIAVFLCLALETISAL